MSAPAPQLCPACDEPRAFSERYPGYLCGGCAERITDDHGRAVVFVNTDGLGGGCRGQYRDTGEPYAGNRCYVGTLVCVASEYRFGGIVIQAVDPTSQ